MQLVTNSAKYDNWGFPNVWVPFGVPGTIKDARGDYNVLADDILNPASLDTLMGVPVYRHHPEAPIHLHNYQDYEVVGICTDKYRLNEAGGGEVLVKLHCPQTISDIRAEILCESSPGYMIKEGVRVYNHLSIFPYGCARGGRSMNIKLEGQVSADGEHLLDEVIQYEGYEVYPIQNPTLENQNIMEQLLGEVLASVKDMGSQMADMRLAMESMKQQEVMEEMNLEGDPLQAKYSEGYAEGIAAGRVLSDSHAQGYEGSDVSEAKSFVVSKAYPDLRLEGFSPDMMTGLYTGALASLAIKALVTPAAQSATVPVVVVEQSTPAKISRLSISK